MAEPRTSATLKVSYPSVGPDLGTPAYVVDEVKAFTYSSNVLAVGDECTFTIVNQDQKYTGKLQRGSTVELYLSHPQVNGGAETLKFLGLITQRRARLSDGTIQITCADKGWHLMNSHAPLWKNLRATTYQQLCDPTDKNSLIDESWGLKGLRAGKDANRLNRNLKLGRQGAQQQLNLEAQVTQAIQVEPGEAVYDLMTRYAQRLNLLVNVSCDGYVQLWNPDYGQKPLYRIEANESGTNVIEGELVEDINSLWTHVECVGEFIGFGEENDRLNPNASHRRGSFVNPLVLPFLHRRTGADGEMYDRALARKQAEWWWKRGVFDSLFMTFDVFDHHQGGVWWESDLMAEVASDLLGVRGLFYVAAVQYESSVDASDIAHVVLRLPGLLSASWGEWKNPPLVRSSKKEASTGTTTTNGQKTEVKK